MSEEEIISKIDDLFPYYQNMKEFDNLRKFYLDKINSVLEQSFKKVSTNKNSTLWMTLIKSEFFSYSALARISIFFSNKPLTFYQILEHIHDMFDWFDFSKDELWVDGIQAALLKKEYFWKSRRHCGRGNIHLEHWYVKHFWNNQAKESLESDMI